MNLISTFTKTTKVCLLMLALSNLLVTTALAQSDTKAAGPSRDTLSSIIGGLPATVSGDFVISFESLAIGQKIFSVTLDQGMSGTATSSVPLNLLGTQATVHIRGARPDLEGDSNRAMIYDGECGGDASSCSGKNDGGHLYHPGKGNLLIISQNNDGSNPDDNYHGGQLYFDFSSFGPGKVTLGSLEVVNSRGEGAVIELYADGERLAHVAIPKSEDERMFDLIEIDVAGVDLMRVATRGQFALNDISFSIP